MCNQRGAPGGMWAGLSAEFRMYHQNSLNVFLHLLTTPMGWMAAIRLAGQLNPSLPAVIAAVHSVVCMATTGVAAGVGTVVLNAVCAYLALNLDLPYDDGAYPWATVALLVAGYVLQDVAHYVTGEKTFQSSYADPVKFFLHTVYLLPLCVDAWMGLRRSPLYWMVPRDTTIQAKLNDMHSISVLKKWVDAKCPNKSTTTHWWYWDLQGEAKAAFDRICNSAEIQNALAGVWDTNAYAIDVVHGMNEVYVASPTALQSSDKVFLLDHIDGPWTLWPFCTVYRVLAAMNPNEVVTTHLTEAKREVMLTTGDVLGFDFNREIHRVSFDTSKAYDEQRLTLKLHYVVYPKVLLPFGKLLAFVTTQYDILARRLFLFTIQPKTFIEKVSARIGVLTTTYAVERFEAFVGINNVAKLAAAYAGCCFAAQCRVIPAVLEALNLDENLAAAGLPTIPAYAAFTDPAMLFLMCTSFIHYLTYIATFYYRSGVNYGRLLRDCKLYKTVSIGQLVYYYAQYQIDPVSLAVVLVGYTLGGWAAYAIGMTRTYFGAELDIVAPKWISAFPYNCVPHPMILGAVIGLAGFFLNEGFRRDFPFLVPAHILLYLTHAAQEEYNIHDADWRSLERFVRKPVAVKEE